MIDIKKLTLRLDSSIKEVLKIINDGSMRVALVVEDSKLIGIVSDPDIRRAMLDGYNLQDSIKNIVNNNPIVCHINDTKEKILQTAINNKIYEIPIVDDDNNLVGIQILDELLKPKIKKYRVIIMAGGLGTRLKPLTNNIPKPLLKVGNRPILDTIINTFVNYGFLNITISVNYKSHMIKEYFKDGKLFGAKIDYIEENKRLGTAGALSLIKNKPTESFIVMNADLLTDVNFSHLLDFHNFEDADATMCVREYDFQVPYGVIETDNSNILSIKEKPIHSFFVNAGIYVLSPKVFEYIPKNKFYDMPTLFNILIQNKYKTISFPIHEYWLDIGRIDEYEKANIEYKEVF